jgi:hypothetical protein
MLWLGLLSIVQVAFLPGYLALRAARLTETPRRTLVLSFALSLVINHFLVLGLVLAGCYRPGVIYAVFAAELALFVWTARRWPGLKLAEVLPAPRWQGPRSLLSGAACLLMAGLAAQAIYHAGDIFHEWDAVVSWNRWAIDWAANRLPRNTAEYPQLLPCNLSLSYVFIQDSSIWFFAKGWLFLFYVLLLLAMFDLGCGAEGAGHLLGLFITYALLVAVLRFRFLSSGYADMPVAFMGYAGVYALLLARGTAEAGRQAKYVLLGAVLCAGAALTKQAGLLVAAVYPLLAWLLVYRGRAKETVPTRLLLPAVVVVALVAPWYVYKQIAFQQHADGALAGYLIYNMHAGRGLAERLWHAGSLLRGAIPLPAAAAALLALVAALRDPVQRWLLALVVLPFALVWAGGFSYELRNLALAVPLAGMAAGVGAAELGRMLARLRRRSPRATAVSAVRAVPSNQGTADTAVAPLTLGHRDSGRSRTEKALTLALSRRERGLLSLRVGYALLLPAVGLLLLGMRISRADLANRQRELQRAVGCSDVNAMLYAMLGTGDRPGVAVATDYLPLQWVPGLEHRYVACGSERLASFQAVYQRPEIGFALVHQTHTSAEVWRYLAAAEARGSSRLLAESRYYRLYQKREDR